MKTLVNETVSRVSIINIAAVSILKRSLANKITSTMSVTKNESLLRSLLKVSKAY